MKVLRGIYTFSFCIRQPAHRPPIYGPRFLTTSTLISRQIFPFIASSMDPGNKFCKNVVSQLTCAKRDTHLRPWFMHTEQREGHHK